MDTDTHQDTPNPKPPSLPRIRTFQQDISAEVSRQGATLTTIVGAERERAARELALGTEEAREPSTNTRNRRSLSLLLGTVGLVLFGILLLIGISLFGSEEYELKDDSPAIVLPNQRILVPNIGSRDIVEALSVTRRNTSLPLGEIAMVVMVSGTATTSASEMLSALGAPAALIRETNELMIGIHSFNRNQPFILIRVGEYDRALAALLEWEEEMGRSLGSFFRPLNGTTPPTTEFTDTVYRNLDIRKSQDTWPIMYGFLQNDLIVITTNEQTVTELQSRLRAAPVR